jgi:GTP-binding protein
MGRYDALMREVEQFDPSLAQRPQIVAVSQIDLPDTRAAWELARPEFEARGITLRGVSAATGEGVREALFALDALLQKTPAPPPMETGTRVAEPQPTLGEPGDEG